MAALNIRDPEVHELARRLATQTGETMTEAVRTALVERLQRTGRPTGAEVERRRRAILELAAQLRRNRVNDPASDDEILGYNEHGTFD
ncbi:MAG: type II toxin-antitoxin system VapB family antitoxin [Geminicoccaceae bacterium]